MEVKLKQWMISNTDLFRSTVVTLKTTPFSQRIMKRRWEKGQFPMASPSLPACKRTNTIRHWTVLSCVEIYTLPQQRHIWYTQSIMDALPAQQSSIQIIKQRLELFVLVFFSGGVCVMWSSKLQLDTVMRNRVNMNNPRCFH